MKPFKRFILEDELDKNTIDVETARILGNENGVCWDTYDINEFRRGLEVEFEHFDTVDGDIRKIIEIVLDHLDENPQYYTKLERVEESERVKPETDVEKTKEKQEREKDDFADKQAQELELARRSDFEKKEAERKREVAQKKAEKSTKTNEDINQQFESLLWGTDELTNYCKKNVPGQD